MGFTKRFDRVCILFPIKNYFTQYTGGIDSDHPKLPMAEGGSKPSARPPRKSKLVKRRPPAPLSRSYGKSAMNQDLAAFIHEHLIPPEVTRLSAYGPY